MQAKRFGVQNVTRCKMSNFDATEVEVDEALHEYFNNADKNKRGTLDGNDIPALLDSLNIDRSKYSVFLKKFDQNKDGKVSFDEFKAVLYEPIRAHVTAKNEKKLRDAFKAFDKDGNGKLTMREIVDLMNYLKVPENATQRFMERADKDKDASLSFEEFCIVVRPKRAQ